MAELLAAGKIESARIRTENIIRSDLLTELHEILELYCELLLARSGLLENTANLTSSGKPPSAKEAVVPLDELDGGIYEAIVVITHAAPRTEIKELQMVRQLFVERYGRQFAEEAARDDKHVVPEKVKRKLRVEPPSKELVENYLKAIASAYEIPYGDDEKQDAKQQEGEDDGGGDNDVRESVEVGASAGPKGYAQHHDDNDEKPTNRDLDEARGTNVLKDATPPPPQQPAGAKSPVSIAPPSPRTDNANPRVKVPPGPPELKPNDKMKKANAGNTAKSSEEKMDSKGPGGKVPDVDDLEARFKLLKR